MQLHPNGPHSPPVSVLSNPFHGVTAKLISPEHSCDHVCPAPSLPMAPRCPLHRSGVPPAKPPTPAPVLAQASLCSCASSFPRKPHGPHIAPHVPVSALPRRTCRSSPTLCGLAPFSSESSAQTLPWRLCLLQRRASRLP